jgi:uncharacterized protein YycO
VSITRLAPNQPTPTNTQPGDFLLIRGTTPLSALIRWGQHLKHTADAAQWTHVAACDGNELVEADRNGVQAVAVSKYDSETRALIRLDAARGKRLKAAKYLIRSEGMEYGFLDFASVAASQLFGFQLIVTTGDAVICSQLVAEMLERCGIFLRGPEELVTPADLYQAFL